MGLIEELARKSRPWLWTGHFASAMKDPTSRRDFLAVAGARRVEAEEPEAFEEGTAESGFLPLFVFRHAGEELLRVILKLDPDPFRRAAIAGPPLAPEVLVAPSRSRPSPGVRTVSLGELARCVGERDRGMGAVFQLVDEVEWKASEALARGRARSDFQRLAEGDRWPDLHRFLRALDGWLREEVSGCQPSPDTVFDPEGRTYGFDFTHAGATFWIGFVQTPEGEVELGLRRTDGRRSFLCAESDAFDAFDVATEARERLREFERLPTTV